MKFLGIDYGEKRIGLAVAEGGFGHAQAVCTVATLADVADYVRANGPFEEIVMGLPRNMDGEETAQTRRAQDAAEELSATLKQEVELMDEFDTSNIAKQRLAGRKGDFKQDEIDAEAAAIILDDFLSELD